MTQILSHAKTIHECGSVMRGFDVLFTRNGVSYLLSCGVSHLFMKHIWCSCFQGCSARLSSAFPRWTPASEVLFPRGTSTSSRWWFRGSSGFWCRPCTLIFIVPETAIVSSQTRSICFPLIAFSLSSFTTSLTPAIRNHYSCFNSLFSGVKIS